MDPTKNDNHVKWYLATQVILSAAHISSINAEFDIDPSWRSIQSSNNCLDHLTTTHRQETGS